MTDRLDDLIAAVRDGSDAGAYDELSALIAADPAARRRYLMHIAVWSELSAGLIAPATATSSKPDLSAAKVRIESKIENRKSKILLPLAATLLLSAAAVAIYVFAIANPQSEIRNLKSAPALATLVESSDGSTVIYEDDIAREGGEYAAGTYSIGSGSAQFLLTSGASVTMNGATELTLHNKMSARLAHGSAAFNCPPSAVGFTVHLPGGTRVVDLGTRFNIDVDDDGNSRVFVDRGSVRIEPKSGEPIVLTRGDIVAVAHDPQRPVRRLGTVIADIAGDWVDASTLPDGWGYFDASAPHGGTLTPLTPDLPVGNAGNRGFGGGHNRSFNLGAVLGEQNGGRKYELFDDGYEHHAAVPGVDLLVHTGDSREHGADGADCLVVRYTISEADTEHGESARIVGSFRELIREGNSVTVSVYHNETPLFSANGNAPDADGRPDVLSESDGAFDLTAAVTAGDTIDFVVFNNGNFGADETAIRGTITIVPNQNRSTPPDPEPAAAEPVEN